jgi:hypothetical protein
VSGVSCGVQRLLPGLESVHRKIKNLCPEKKENLYMVSNGYATASSCRPSSRRRRLRTVAKKAKKAAKKKGK